ncbi:MAG: hypothetical protein IPJ61_12855 [Tessaracoccus sp.]|nr:hypothetical protein [Tessaracoccus sp.]MBK7821930.1 hypothetical protein [Tessaracoccus sp.]
MGTYTFGRDLKDKELATFHGGTCTITITKEGEVKKSGDCKDVVIKER